MKLSGISIVLPCHNERANLERVVRQAATAGNASATDHEIIVVFDGSSDGTPAEAERLKTIYPTLRILRHTRNRGYGAAVWTGMKAARMDFVFFTDADGQFDPNELSKLVDLLGDGSGVLGHRMNRQDPRGRGMLGSVYTALIRLVLRVRCKDMNCAFKIFRRSAVADVSLLSTGALFNAELLARLQARGHVFGEVGVHHYGRRHGRQSGARPDVILRALYELPYVWWSLFRPERRPENNSSHRQEDVSASKASRQAGLL